VQRIRTLTVSEDDDWRSLFARALLEMGCEVHTASDGMEATDLVRKHSYDLLLVDREVGQMGQIEFILNVRDVAPRMPLVVVCGSKAGWQRAFWARCNVFSVSSRAEVAADLARAVETAGQRTDATTGDPAPDNDAG